jgi:hypothetical protein
LISDGNIWARVTIQRFYQTTSIEERRNSRREGFSKLQSLAWSACNQSNYQNCLASWQAMRSPYVQNVDKTPSDSKHWIVQGRYWHYMTLRKTRKTNQRYPEHIV